jgi:hypothetical protein
VAPSYITDEDAQLSMAAADGLLLVGGAVSTAYKSATLVAGPPASEGSVSVATDGGFIFTPAPNFHGTTSFTFKPVSKDGAVSGDVQTATITMRPVNDRPTTSPSPLVFNTDEGVAVTGDLAQGASLGPPDEASSQAWLGATIMPGPNTHGTVTPQGAAGFVYTPSDGFSGVATFTYTLRDDGGTANGGNDTSATATATVTGARTRRARLAPLLHMPPAHGRCMHPAPHTASARPLRAPCPTCRQCTAAAHCPDLVTSRCCHGPARNPSPPVFPTARDLGYDAPADADLFVQPEQGLLSRGGEVLTGRRVVVGRQPAKGKLLVAVDDGSFVFTPVPGSSGDDSFTYHTEVTAADGGVVKSAVTTVTLRIGGAAPGFEGRGRVRGRVRGAWVIDAGGRRHALLLAAQRLKHCIPLTRRLAPSPTPNPLPPSHDRGAARAATHQ